MRSFVIGVSRAGFPALWVWRSAPPTGRRGRPRPCRPSGAPSWPPRSAARASPAGPLVPRGLGPRGPIRCRPSRSLSPSACRPSPLLLPFRANPPVSGSHRDPAARGRKGLVGRSARGSATARGSRRGPPGRSGPGRRLGRTEGAALSRGTPGGDDGRGCPRLYRPAFVHLGELGGLEAFYLGPVGRVVG